LQKTVLQVIANSQTIEKEVSSPNGARYQLRILPYRTIENKIDGAVVTLVDVSSKVLIGTA
jgi:two-component system, chemotaxis family, CheB/CheR fusion protein